MITIQTTTKPNGAYKSWLEVGQFTIDNFGDKVWKHSIDRYPNKDNRLNVQRKYEGKGKAQEIRWLIEIPEDYPVTILCKSGDDRVEDRIIWEPEKRNGLSLDDFIQHWGLSRKITLFDAEDDETAIANICPECGKVIPSSWTLNCGDKQPEYCQC